MSNRAEITNYSFPILMGKKNTVLDMTEWNTRSQQAFDGKIIPMAPGMNAEEMRKMGFLEASIHFSHSRR